MANEFNDKIIKTNGEEINEQLIEKLFPKCRPKYKSHECQRNDILNENYRDFQQNRNKQILIDLDFINDNTMNETKEQKVECLNQTDNSVKNIGFKLDQLLLSPEEEEYRPLSHNFINKPFIDSNEDIESEDSKSDGKDFNLRESRIEIAGGREIFSASKSKLNKKRLNSNLITHNNLNNEEKVLQNLIKSKRNNTTQTLILNNSNNSNANNRTHENCDISVDSLESKSTKPLETNSSVNQLLHSPICDLLTDLSAEQKCKHKHKLSSSIVVYEDFNSKPNSDDIIYDDIEDLDKKNGQIQSLSVKPIANDFNKLSSNYEINYINCGNDNPLVNDNHSIGKCVEEVNSFEKSNQCEENAIFSTENNSSVNENANGIARIIGTVPIAQYDGSPRRYGPKPPGYPQRVINNEELSVGLANSNSETSKGLVDISCDELVKSILSIPLPYENSSTNSSMNGSNGSKSNANSHSSGIQSAPNSEVDKNDVLMETTDMNVYQFSDLDYKLYRMDSMVGNSYVGKRLATLSTANSEEDRSVAVSPSKSLNDANSMLAHENELILLHQRVRQHILNEIVSADRSSISTGVGTELEPEILDRVEESNRHFTLSPDITDCDSNEIESEISLEGSLLSNSKIVAMPVLEDGLSSGVPSSDNELEEEANADTPITLSYSKKRISERIEEELVSKLKAKLKRNDNLCEHHRDSQNNTNTTLNHSETHSKS